MVKITVYDAEGAEVSSAEMDVSEDADPTLVVSSATGSAVLKVTNADNVAVRYSSAGMMSFIPAPEEEEVVEPPADEPVVAEAPAEEPPADEGGMSLNV